MSLGKKNGVPIELFSDIYHECSGSQKQILDILDLEIPEFEVLMATLKKLGFHREAIKRNTVVPDRHLLKEYIELKKSNVEIAEIHGCTTDDVTRWYKIFGIKKPVFGKRMRFEKIESIYPIGTKEQFEETKTLIQGFLEWRPLKELAIRCGVDEETMRGFLRHIDVKTKAMHRFSDDTPPVKVLYDLFINKKMTLDVVASLHEVSTTQAKRWQIHIEEYAKRLNKLL